MIIFAQGQLKDSTPVGCSMTWKLFSLISLQIVRCVSLLFMNSKIMWLAAKGNIKALILLTSSKEGIISFSVSQNLYLQMSVLAAIMFVEEKTLHPPVHWYSHMLDPHLCPPDISFRGITWTKHDHGDHWYTWNFASGKIVAHCNTCYGIFRELLVIPSTQNFLCVSSQGWRALKWAPALLSCFGVGQ